MANIKDVSKMAKVSITTVSNVLNGHSNVSQETRKRVLGICRELNYHPNFMARNLKSSKTNTILFNFSDFDRYFYLKIIQGINDCLNENEIGLIVCTNKTIDMFLRNGAANGAIILDKEVTNSQVLSAARPEMKIVMLDRVIQSPYVYNILPDNYTSMKNLTVSLIKKGYHKFAYVGGMKNTTDHIERLKGFRDALQLKNIPFEEANYFSGDYSFNSGIEAGKKIIEGKLPIDIIVCANDDIAMGVATMLKNYNIPSPKEIAVTGFDGDKFFDQEIPDITTVMIPYYDIGYQAANTLIQALNEKEFDSIQRIKTKIRWGKTTL